MAAAEGNGRRRDSKRSYCYCYYLIIASGVQKIHFQFGLSNLKQQFLK
jgi:hypothetical protein